jgi:F0F1-type ATP synthase assembly protein I
MADDAENEAGREEDGGARDEGGVTRKSSAAYAAGLAIFFSVMTFLGLGWFLDNYFETSPWLLVTGILLGSAVGFYEFIKIMSRNG